MKKLFIAFLLSLTCACTVAGMAACKPDSESSGSSSSSAELGEEILTLRFVEEEGYTFEKDFAADKKFAVGENAVFRLKVGAFYTGNHVVFVNGVAVAPHADDPYAYTVRVTEDAEITVTGIQKDTTPMDGLGTFDNPFVVTRPVHLLEMAEGVNAGNSTYVNGTYVLANDIDCGGEKLKVIGDLSTENSYFAGCFVSDSDSVTGERMRYTISNFTINSDDTNYVGLFGAVYADLSVTNSALFYGIRLENFTINATLPKSAPVDTRSIFAGSLIGYGIGVNVWLCDAVEGAVNLDGNDEYFSFAGGLMGYQQAFYAPALDYYFPSEIAYSTVDVDVDVVGLGMYAGGITGYLATNNPYGATAFIHNSYASGDVSGALYSGGIVGGLSPYTSVGNCYSTGTVSAITDFTLEDTTESFKPYCYAYAGGIVGYAENESVVSDCFSVSAVYATSASAGCNGTGAIVGSGDKTGTQAASANTYVVENCLTKADIDLNDTTFFTSKLGWGSHDWIFTKGSYPTIMYESTETTVKASMTVKYIDPKTGEEIKVSGETGWTEAFLDTSMQSMSSYTPIGNYFQNGGLSMQIQADNGYRAFGYFFDEACTRKVPYSYVPQKDVTLYVGFADPSPIEGKTFSLMYEKSVNALTVTFEKNGIVSYSDGNSTQLAYYLFDGENIVIQEARLARYFDGEIVADTTDPNANQDANFDIERYSYYDFKGKLQDGALILYDGTYFTEENPLVSKPDLFRGEFYIGDTVYAFYGEKATKTIGTTVTEYDGYTVTADTIILGNETINRSDLREFDPFRGTWTKSANVNKVYTFDGKGGWTYTFGTQVQSGTYTFADDSITFHHDGVNYTANYDTDGMLTVTDGNKVQHYYAAGSYVGVWQADGLTIELFGIGREGIGKATVTQTNGSVSSFVYEMSETDGYVVLYYPHNTYVKDAVYGYFTFSQNNTLLAALIDSYTGSTTQYSFSLLDCYNGEWICDAEEFIDAEFRFNGNGLYSTSTGSQGKLTIIKNGVETTVVYTLDETLGGTFTYDGKRYSMIYDEDENSVVLTNADGATLERKDELANMDFVDLDGVSYSFDGRSNLSTGGILTIKNGEKENSYVYTKAEIGWTVLDGNNGNKTVGSVERTDNCYTLTIDGKATELYLSNEFIGKWAVGGQYGLLEVGPTDLYDTIQATFLGNPVTITQLDVGMLTFRYRKGNKPLTYYVYIVEDSKLGYDLLVLSQYTNLYSGDYSICTKANDFYGEWTRNDGAFAMEFDGITSGSYANGNALLYRGDKDHATSYYYTVGERGIMLWSQETLGGTTAYYQLEWLDVNSEEAKASDVFVQKEGDTVVKAFRRVKVDSLYMTEATDAKDGKTVYFFDGLGKLYVGDTFAYEYEVVSFDNTLRTATLTLTKDDKTYTATLNYKDNTNITLLIEETSQNA